MKKTVFLFFLTGFYFAFAQTPQSYTAIAHIPNAYAMLSSQASPLQYNDNVNTVTLILRKASTYLASPANNSGAVIAKIGRNFGTVWDSTCLWSSTGNLARYPQGGIYNPPGNTNVNNAYVLGMGPTSTGTLWNGNFYASKTLSVSGTNSPGPDAQFLSNLLPSYPPTQARHHFSKNNFTATDDGVVRSMAGIMNDANAAVTNPRGAMLVKGSFNAGSFTWSTDSFIPSVMAKTNGERYVNPNAYQAWNEAGTTGYVMILGVAAGATGANKSQQPLIYKTTNSGISWTALPSIDFNNTLYLKILNKLSPVQNNWCTTKPYFKNDEGIACVVDENNQLHIISTVASASNDETDLLDSLYTYNKTGNYYYWRFAPGYYPFVYDFYGDGSAPWSVNVIDSLSSQSPGWTPGAPGYTANPWDPDPGNNNQKIPCGMRIQAGRSPDGRHILYTYAESDTNFTGYQSNYNSLPNIKAKAWDASTNKVSQKVNITRIPSGGNNPNVSNRAHLHFISQAVATTTSGSTVSFTVPLSVANSNPYSQLTENKVWYTNATLTFSNYTSAALGTGTTCVLGLEENRKTKQNPSFSMFPNPAENLVELNINLESENTVKIYLHNIIGQQLSAYQFKGYAGGNSFHLTTSDLNAGLYLVTLEYNGLKTTQRLVKK